MIVRAGRTLQLQPSQRMAPRGGKLKDPRALFDRCSRIFDTESAFSSSKVEYEAKKCKNDYTSSLWNNARSREKYPLHVATASLCFEQSIKEIGTYRNLIVSENAIEIRRLVFKMVAGKPGCLLVGELDTTLKDGPVSTVLPQVPSSFRDYQGRHPVVRDQGHTR